MALKDSQKQFIPMIRGAVIQHVMTEQELRVEFMELLTKAYEMGLLNTKQPVDKSFRELQEFCNFKGRK